MSISTTAEFIAGVLADFVFYAVYSSLVLFQNLESCITV